MMDSNAEAFCHVFYYLQIVGTAILLFCVMAVTDTKGINSPKHLIPMVLSLVITAVCVAYGLNCGAILSN